jgi:hypothetical protein
MARIDPQLEKVIEYLREILEQNEKAGKGEDGRYWFDLEGLGSTSGDEKDCHDAFDRTASNDDYTKARENPDAQVNEIMLAKLAGEFLMGCERDMRMRRRTRVRHIAHQAGRACGYRSGSGPLRRNVIDWLQRTFLKAE